MTHADTRPSSLRRWLHFCESGSDTHEALTLASATEAIFTRILQLSGSDCIWSAGWGHFWLCQASVSFPCHNPQVPLLSKWEHHCQKDLKRTKKKIDLGNLCVLAIDKALMVGSRSLRRVTVRLKEKHPGTLCCHWLLKLTGSGGCCTNTRFHQIQRVVQ